MKNETFSDVSELGNGSGSATAANCLKMCQGRPPRLNAVSIKKESDTQMYPQRPSEWRKYKSGMCKGCWGGCCTLPVEASVADLIRLGVATEDEACASLKKLARRLEKEGIIQAFVPSSQLFVLEQRHGRDCRYLHPTTRLCTVYEKRPEVCRQFPKIGPRPGWCPQASISSMKKVAKF